MTAWIWLSGGRRMAMDSRKIALWTYHRKKWRRASFAPKQEQVDVVRIHGSVLGHSKGRNLLANSTTT